LQSSALATQNNQDKIQAKISSWSELKIHKKPSQSLTGASSPEITAYMCVHMMVYNCSTQYNIKVSTVLVTFPLILHNLHTENLPKFDWNDIQNYN